MYRAEKSSSLAWNHSVHTRILYEIFCLKSVVFLKKLQQFSKGIGFSSSSKFLTGLIVGAQYYNPYFGVAGLNRDTMLLTLKSLIHGYIEGFVKVI